jgi:hypothetical protein
VARPKREHCRACGRHIRECGSLSKRGKCVECGTRAITEAARQIEAREGPYYDKYKREIAAYSRSLTGVE